MAKKSKPVSPTKLKHDESFDVQAASVDPGDRTLSAVGYISILCILPLMLRPHSEFCQFHGKQSLAIFIIEILLLSVMSFLLLFGMAFGVGLVSIAFLCVQIYGLWQAWQGQKTEIPPFAGLAKKYLKWDVVADAYGISKEGEEE